MSPTSPALTAPASLARALAMLVKTVVSWAATPFTVSTRFGMRSDRRWSWVWIWAFAWLTRSSRVWIVL